MKKLIIILMALVMVAPMAVAADMNKALNKALEKEYKQKKKQLEKEKWTTMSSRTLDVSLLKHYQKLNDDENDAREVLGTGTAKSKNAAYQMASNNAMIKYAGDAGSSLKGRVMTDLFANGADNEADFDHFFSAYGRLVEKEIKGEMQESMALVRQLPNGSYEINTYYIISEHAAAKARMRALKSALEESEAAQKYADKISEFVNAGFDN